MKTRQQGFEPERRAAPKPGTTPMGGRARYTAHGGQKGFAIVSAIFLVVVLGLLGALIVSLSTTQQIGAARDLAGSRAYFAARAGIEWGVYQAVQAGSCNASATLPALSGGVAGFTVQVACSRTGPFDEGGSTINVYQITSTATTGTLGQVDYAERQLQAVVSTP